MFSLNNRMDVKDPDEIGVYERLIFDTDATDYIRTLRKGKKTIAEISGHLDVKGHNTSKSQVGFVIDTLFERDPAFPKPKIRKNGYDDSMELYTYSNDIEYHVRHCEEPMNVSIIKNWLRCRYGKKFREDDIRFMIRDRYGILMNIGKVPENDFGCTIKLPVKEKTSVKFYRKGEKYSRDRDAEGFD